MQYKAIVFICVSSLCAILSVGALDALTESVCISTYDSNPEISVYTMTLDDQLQSINDADIIIVSDSLLETSNVEVMDDIILETMYNHKPIIFDSKVYFDEKSSIVMPFSTNSENCDAYGVYMDGQGAIHQMIASGYGPDASKARVTSWASEVSLYETLSTSIFDSQESSWMSLGSLRIDNSLASRGDYSATYKVYKQLDVAMNDRSFYAIHYVQNGAPNVSEGYRLADLKLKTHAILGSEMELLETKPNSTSGTSTNGVEISFEGGYSGGPEAGAGIAFTWDYSIEDVIVSNTSNHSQNRVDIWHDVDEKKTVGKGYSAEPGILLSFIGHGGSFIDAHTITTCKYTHSILWDKCTDFIDNTFYVELYIPGNDSFSIFDPSPH